MNYITRIGQGADHICMGLIDTGVSIKKGLLFIAAEGSYIADSIYGMEGFEKWTKALIANLRFASFFPRCKGVFDKCLKMLEMQKDLYYATMFIGSMDDFVGKRINLAGKKIYYFKLPRLGEDEKGGVDLVKILYAIGNFLEPFKFAQKYQMVSSLGVFTEVANRLASTKVWTYGNTQYTLDHLPIINTLWDKPKDFFISLACGVELYRCSKKPLFEIENLFKITGSLGKVVLITFGRSYGKTCWFSIIDVITQDVSLISRIYSQRKKRQQRLNAKRAAAAAA